MDSKIRIYQVEFKPDQNAVVESLQQYLNTAPLRYKSDTFQYQQIAIDMVIKVPMEQSKLNIPGNYVEIIQDDIHYYFYIINAKWTAKNTLRLVLSMDTLNTFWIEIQTSLDKQTHVSRKYYDRWKRINTSAYPIIDKHPEDINTPPTVQMYKPQIVGNETEHWTLVYKTEYDYKDSLNQNPVVCFAIPSKNYSLQEQYNYRTLTTQSFELNTALAFDFEHTPAAQIWINGTLWFDSKINDAYAIIKFAQVGAKRKLHLFKHDSTGDATEFADSVEIKITVFMYRQASWVDTTTPKDQLTWIYPVLVGAQQLGSFNQWYMQNKADPTIVKIIELPYAPFDIQEDTDGKIAAPAGWNVAPLSQMACFSLFDADKTEGPVALIDNLGPESLDLTTLSLTEAANPLQYETKLWNSAYHISKFIYDNNFHIVKLEEYEQKDAMDYPVRILFKASSGMDGSSIFTFENSERLDSDFGNYLICNRSTEIPYYTNEYLNYLRYGKAIDERNRAVGTASTLVSGVGGAFNTGASLLFALSGAGLAGAGVGGILGTVVGLASAGIAAYSSIQKANDQINAKIDNYTHQASGVSGVSDLSIFKAYGKNKLLQVSYEPVQELKESIGRYFELFGYSCDIYGVPNLKTRIWSDYFVMEPVFYQNPILEAYQADIATRMKAGFRIFHRNDDISNENGILIHYDFNNEYENWERSITGR